MRKELKKASENMDAARLLAKKVLKKETVPEPVRNRLNTWLARCDENQEYLQSIRSMY